MPDTKFELSLTDPDKLREQLRGLMGDTIATVMREQLADSIRELGLDKIDRRHLVFPEANGRAGVLSVNDLQDRTPWSELPGEVRGRRRRMMEAWFRRALFDVPLGQSLGDGLEEPLVRALSTTDGEGGYLIPPGFIAEVTRDIPKLSQVFPYVRRIPVVSNTGEMPKVSTNASVSWGSDNTDIDEGDPAFDTTTYAINRLNAFVMLSREVASDSNPDIVAVVTELFQEALASEIDRVIAVGSGNGQPLGLYSASGITNVTVTTLDYDSLVNLKESVDQRYHADPSFRWVFNQNVKAALMKVVDERGLPIWQAPTARDPGLILGLPYSIEHHCPNNFVFVGALRNYIWFDRQTFAVERTTEGGTAFRKHQLHIKFYGRFDGKYVAGPTNPAARSRVVEGVQSLT